MTPSIDSPATNTSQLSSDSNIASHDILVRVRRQLPPVNASSDVASHAAPISQHNSKKYDSSDPQSYLRVDSNESAVLNERQKTPSRSAAAPASNRQGTYDVGFGKPPARTQFKKGHSGNPTGRPRYAKDLRTIVEEESNAIVTYTENGKLTKSSKRQLAIKGAMNKAVKGDLKALQFITKLMESLAPRRVGGIHAGASDTSAEEREATDTQILQLFGLNLEDPSSTEPASSPVDPSSSHPPLTQ